MSQRFAADPALQLLQIIALESSDSEYSDSKSDELNNVIVDIQKRKILLIQMANIQTRKHQSTQMMESARSSSDNDDQILLSKDRSHWRRSVPSQVTTGQLQQHNIVRSVQDLHHISHPASYTAFLFLHPHLFQQAHPEKYSEVHYFGSTSCHWK